MSRIFKTQEYLDKMEECQELLTRVNREANMGVNPVTSKHELLRKIDRLRHAVGDYDIMQSALTINQAHELLGELYGKDYQEAVDKFNREILKDIAPPF